MSTARLFDRYYHSCPGFVNGTTYFHGFCAKHIAPGSRILEIGAGPSNRTSTYLASLGSVLVGADISDEVKTNGALAEAYVYDGKTLPFPTRSFDACVSDVVLEHVEKPSHHFAEVARVLKPGGVYCFRTPNLWHYTSLGARLTPHSFHRLFANRLRGLPGDSHEPYPTYYRANTRSRIIAYCSADRWRSYRFELIEKEPSYGRFGVIGFYPMMAYERCVNRFDWLARFRVTILAALISA